MDSKSTYLTNCSLLLREAGFFFPFQREWSRVRQGDFVESG